MAVKEPRTELDARFSSEEAGPVAWAEGRRRIEEADVFWLSTVRPDGRPHVTPLIAVWADGALYFCTGADERKARNLARNANCILTFHGHGETPALVFEVAPSKVLGFRKGDEFSQTRWSFREG